jgi:hypothetical protein
MNFKKDPAIYRWSCPFNGVDIDCRAFVGFIAFGLRFDGQEPPGKYHISITLNGTHATSQQLDEEPSLEDLKELTRRNIGNWLFLNGATL